MTAQTPAPGVPKTSADRRQPTNAYIMGCLAGYGPRSMLREGYLAAYMSKQAQTALQLRREELRDVEDAPASKTRSAAQQVAERGRVSGTEVPPLDVAVKAPAADDPAPNPNVSPYTGTWFDAAMSIGIQPWLAGYTRQQVAAANAARKARLAAGTAR